MHASKFTASDPPAPTTAPAALNIATPAIASNRTTSRAVSGPALDPVMIRSNTTDFLHCLNSRHFHLLPLFLSPRNIQFNNTSITTAQYSAYLQALISTAPDMTFHLGQILIDANNRRVACVLAVEGTPSGRSFRGHAVSGKARKVRYFEQVTWRLDEQGRIEGVESTVDEDKVARQCARTRT